MFEHRDLAVALGRERTALPVRPAVLEAQSCELGHEVQLGRPHVPVGSGVVHQLAVDRHPVMGPRDLPDRIVEGFDPDMIRFAHEHPSGVAGGYTAKLRDHRLHDEAAARYEMASSVAEDSG